MFGKRKKYVMVEDSQTGARIALKPAAVTEEGEGFEAKVVYQLTSLIANARGPVCVVGFGSPMKSAVKTCVQLECSDLWVTGTEDKERGFACSGAAKVTFVGAKFDARLFSNEHAVLQALKKCGASIALVLQPELASSPRFVASAEAAGCSVFAPMGKDKTNIAWSKADATESARARVAAGIEWRACPKCKLFHDAAEVLADHGTCPTCKELYRLNSNERIAETFDEGTFEEWDAVVEETDPLGFPNYDGLLEKMRGNSGLEEAVRCGRAQLAGMDVAFCVMESTFMMGSMGSVVGEKITRAIERATELGLPLVIFTASGGARMQEGLVSLMQMAKISAAVERHGRRGLLYISVVTDPTTGGVTASFAMQGDIIISEPHALIGFAGRRVIQDTIRQTLPEGFQTAEFALEHGLIDAIVPREDLRATLAHAIALHKATGAKRDAAPAEAGNLADAVEMGQLGLGTAREQLYGYRAIEARLGRREFAEPVVQIKQQPSVPNPFARLAETVREAVGLDEQSKKGSSVRRALSKRDVADVPGVKPVAKEPAQQEENHAWESVLLARNVRRPTAQYYIDVLVDGFIELHGDRMFADDGAILAGIGWIEGQPVTVVAEEKGADLNQRIARNFGCPQPEGYRKSLRLMKQAEKFGRPIVCFVDTQGAFCGMEAEERGQGNAIAENLVVMAGLTVPVVCVVLGEGGSGGALALAVGNRVAMQDHAVYSVLSPEGFASILWKDRSRAAEAAAVMKMSAREACEMGIIEEVLCEGDGPAHVNPLQAAGVVREFVLRSLRELEHLTPEELQQQRYNRFRRF